jgi:hypothetical protein
MLGAKEYLYKLASRSLGCASLFEINSPNIVYPCVTMKLSEKISTEHNEVCIDPEMAPEKDGPMKRDYSGAIIREKSELELKLIKKLDYRIMVSQSSS